MGTIKLCFSTTCKWLSISAAAVLLSACVPSAKAKIEPQEPDVTGPLPSISSTLNGMREAFSNAVDNLQLPAKSAEDIKVGLLLPLSGKSSDVGKQLLDAASLAVFDARTSNTSPANITLIPKDTGTSATNAATGASEVIGLGAQAVVGPLFSQSVTEAAKVSVPARIPLLALTNNRQVATAGIVIFGFAPEDQVKTVIEYGLSKGVNRVALLAPNDAYGAAIENALRGVMASKGGLVTSAERYGKRGPNINAAAKRLVEQYRLQPFTGLMIADNPANTETMIAALKAEGLDMSSITLMGTALLDDMDARPTANLQGILYATTSPANYTSFNNRFKATYGYTPKRIASLAYDAVRLIAERSTQGTIALEGDASGSATGAFSINAGGITERSLAVLRVTATGTAVVQPAARKL